VVSVPHSNWEGSFPSHSDAALSVELDGVALSRSLGLIVSALGIIVSWICQKTEHHAASGVNSHRNHFQKIEFLFQKFSKK
jgi:hypothetical protein